MAITHILGKVMKVYSIQNEYLTRSLGIVTKAFADSTKVPTNLVRIMWMGLVETTSAKFL